MGKWTGPIALSLSVLALYTGELWQRSYFERDGRMHPISRLMARFVVTEAMARERRVKFVQREMKRSDEAVHWYSNVAFFGGTQSENEKKERMLEKIYRKYRTH